MSDIRGRTRGMGTCYQDKITCSYRAPDSCDERQVQNASLAVAFGAGVM